MRPLTCWKSWTAGLVEVRQKSEGERWGWRMKSGEGRRGGTGQMAGYQKGFSELESEAVKDHKATIMYHPRTCSPLPLPPCLTLSLNGHGCSSVYSCRDSTLLSHVNS